MKISKKILIVFLILAFICLITCQFIYASSPQDIADAIKGATNSSYTINPTVASVLGLILYATQVAVMGIFIIRLTMLGIRYFSSSALDTVQAETKTQLRRTLIFGGLAIASLSIMAAIFDAFS